ncbi:MAG TPA: hypothetical protein VE093_21515 [Polyangiaceae bacterium]|jgi:hypothetical protein|nr:hypothetical protein [Polyangiaceae bacterium]
MAPSPTSRLFAALLAARVAFGLAYLAGSIRRSPVPWYYPLERRWAFESSPSAFGMEWYGRTASALLAALVAFGILWLLSSRGPLARALARPATVLAAARAGGLILLVDFTYFGWVLMHQTPVPLPLPEGALPR